MHDAASEEPRTSGLLQSFYVSFGPAARRLREPEHASVPYRSAPRRGVPPLADVYLPERGRRRAASVILVHGGGFLVGHRRMKPVRLLATRLADEGHAVCSIDYRLLLRGGGIAEALDDVHTAARWWRDEHARFDCDAERVSMVGLSAGAALTMLHAGQTELRYHRLVSIYGPTRFDGVSGRRASLYMRWLMGTRDREVWKHRSPLTHAMVPTPLLLVHGTADQLVPVAHAERLHAARTEAGLPTELELVPGMPHGWLNDATLPETERAVQRVVDFVRG